MIKIIFQILTQASNQALDGSFKEYGKMPKFLDEDFVEIKRWKDKS